jgi:hypothetical protein
VDALDAELGEVLEMIAKRILRHECFDRVS